MLKQCKYSLPTFQVSYTIYIYYTNYLPCQNLLSSSNSVNMGQSLKKMGNDDDDMKGRDIQPIIEDCYDKYFVNTENWTCADFCHAICQTVEEINTSVRSTQIRVPKTETLDRAFHNHHKGKGKKLSREEFQKILQEIIMDTGVTGIGAKDILFFLFGVPVTTLFFKQRLFPTAVPNEVFIPAVTSATVFLLAKLNKI
ncbi:PREDICTED: uncharacterized protein LOC109182204 [Ipomoea nil]|uniref:uncharacterized protein LOC109182204 n=1 Tax=Ipomoea nil TaxID=35883 RepID=UPI0009016E83|nr:PREDICTED: uncharacterized protein LOC109182204 [Ipomoea nil]